MDDINAIISKEIRMLCAKHNINRRKLSCLTGISHWTICRILNDKTPCSIQNLFLITNCLDENIVDFFKNVNNQL